MKFSIGTRVSVKIGELQILGTVSGYHKNGQYIVKSFGTEIGCFEEDMEETK
jgi:uncharacterized protein YodC (DUF2158 family)